MAALNSTSLKISCHCSTIQMDLIKPPSCSVDGATFAVTTLENDAAIATKCHYLNKQLHVDCSSVTIINNECVS